jgi:hypothetical protein
MCLLLVDKGIKPEEIVKCINQSTRPIESNENYDFSDDSDEEAHKIEKEILNLNNPNNINKNHKKEKKNVTNKKEDSDTESDSDFSLITKKIDEENIFTDNYLETMRRLKRFFDKNKKNIPKDKITSHVDNTHHNINGTSEGTNNFYVDSIINLNSGKEFINRKRKNNPGHGGALNNNFSEDK